MNIIQTTISGFLAIVEAAKGCEYVHFLYEKPIKMKGTWEGGTVTKRVQYHGELGSEYANKGNNQRKKDKAQCETEFVPLPRPWGTWRAYPRTAEHKGHYYLRLHRRDEDSHLQDIKSVVLEDGNEVTKDRLEEIKAHAYASEFKPMAEAKRQTAHGITENQIRPIEIKDENWRVARMGGNQYEIAH